MTDDDIILGCPVCDADVPYEDVIPVEGNEDLGECPVCCMHSPIEGGWLE